VNETPLFMCYIYTDFSGRRPANVSVLCVRRIAVGLCSQLLFSYSSICVWVFEMMAVYHTST